jgi:hypothetical protein
MTSLTQTAVIARKIIRYGIFFLIFLIVGKIVFDIGFKIYRTFFPAPPPPATVAFGKLPKLSFPENNQSLKFTYILETPEGELPKLSTQAKVYFMPKPSASLLALEVAKDKASALGFKPEEQQVSQTIYRFPHKTAPSTLEMNIVTGIFSISYDLKNDPSAIDRKPPFGEIAASAVRAYLSLADLLPEDLTGTLTPDYLKVEGDKFVTTDSLSDASITKVKLTRKNYDNLPVLSPYYNEANVWFMVSGASERDKQIIAGEFHYFPIDETKYATYPLKTPQEVWDEFNQAKGYLVTPGINKDGDTVTIRRIYLAYYDSGTPTEFLQPIYIFEGDKGLVSYLPAVSSDYYGE